jgi:proteasome lid subunit RPN8/RPN11
MEMGMRLEISRSVVDGVLAEANRSPAHEACGLLFGTAARIDRFQTCTNTAIDPRREFEIDPAQLIAVHRAGREGADTVVGCFHSHPLGSPEPSATDAACAAPDGWIWLIAGGGEVGVWRAVAHGTRHGRFNAVHWQSV